MTYPTLNNRYRVLREIARGGMGRVLLVEDTHRKNQRLALKTMLPGARTADFLERFREEFAGLARLSHPNIAAAYDFGLITGTEEYFFTTELIEGVDLFKGTGDATVDQLLSIVTQLFRGLGFIHSHRLMHNDLKPANILLEEMETRSGTGEPADISTLEAAVYGLSSRVRIIDFGLLSAEGTTWPRIIGTPHYLSPERIRCARADRRADLYSAGIVIYAICARALPFNAPSTQGLLRQHLDERPPPLGAQRPDLPPALVQLVDRLLEKDPMQRFESADAALAFLDQELGSKLSPEVRTTERGLSTGAIVERSDELAWLESHLRRLAGGASEIPAVVITGLQGSGKTRLAEELRGPVQVSGGAYIRVSGSGVEGHLAPVASAILQGLQTCGAPGLEDLANRLEAQGEDATRDLPDFLEAFLVEQSLARQVVLVLDDFQEASDTIRRFVFSLIPTVFAARKGNPSGPRLLVILPRRASAGVEDPSLKHLPTLELGPLGEDSTRYFLQRLFDQEEIPFDLLAPLIKTAGGNPGLLLELARELVVRGLVKHNGATWAFPRSIAGISLPTNLQGALASRFAGQEGTARDLLEWLACCRTAVSGEVLTACLGVDSAVLDGLLRSLRDQGLVATEEATGGKSPTHALAHLELRALALKGLDAERMRFMHQQLAQAHEAAAGGKVEDDLCETLAGHWLDAGNLPGFLRYAPRAAAALRGGGNLKLAADYHRRIAEAMPDEAAAKKIQSFAKLAEMHELLWDLESSRRDLKALLSLGKTILRPADRSALLRRIACLELASNRPREALNTLGDARTALPQPQDPLALLAIESAEIWGTWLTGDLARALKGLERVTAQLEQLRPSTPREKAICSSVTNQIGAILHQTGRLSAARDIYRRQLEQLKSLDLPQALSATRCSLGTVLLDLGSRAEAEAELRESMVAARRLGDRRTLARARERLGELNLRYGDAKGALLFAQVALEEAEGLQGSARANALRTLARLHDRAGQQDEAIRLCSEALELHRCEQDPVGETLARTELARLLLQDRRVERAGEEIRAARRLAEERGVALVLGQLLLLEAELAAEETGLLDAEKILAAERLFTATGHRQENCEAKTLLVRRAIATGKQEKAAALLAEARALIEESGSHEQKLQFELFEALVTLENGPSEEPSRRIAALEIQARNAILPRLAQQCKEALRQIAQETGA